MRHARYELIKHRFPERSDHRQIPERLIGTLNNKLKMFKCLHDVLVELKVESDFDKKFKNLSEKIIDTEIDDFVTTRTTPDCIKELKPPEKSSILSLMPHTKTVSGDYPMLDKYSDGVTRAKLRAEGKKTHHSCSRSYAEKRSMLSALSQVVKQLWAWHAKYEGDISAMPTQEVIQAALEKVDSAAAASSREAHQPDQPNVADQAQNI